MRSNGNARHTRRSPAYSSIRCEEIIPDRARNSHTGRTVGATNVSISPPMLGALDPPRMRSEK